ncbi:MAG: hypothetical protein GTO63_31040 [Anaerolineae bacterium]|nr:hypothetical protein [Anaerolineae bacterium]NIN99129.1 hypothetical protein [Anaerolineae bacterium]NIQ81970.1 hypothetical protein [Anaerolineae bacterium]
MKEEQGLLIVLTGTGKGKTNAALGLAWRAVGHGAKAAIIYFTGPIRATFSDHGFTCRGTPATIK